MKRTWIWLALPLLAGCPKGGGKAPADPTSDALAGWARQQLDLRTWRSCARAAEDVNLEDSYVIFEVDATGHVGVVVIEPVDRAHDPGMICLQMELAHPPSPVPHQGEARQIRLRAGSLHEVPTPTGA